MILDPGHILFVPFSAKDFEQVERQRQADDND